ncbi:MAG: biotin/lipoyl-binding protein [Deltaproteobacteria bacterium]|nr:biotin/lipoyl-binding protein [Deltaproteobacteria bacterium]
MKVRVGDREVEFEVVSTGPGLHVVRLDGRTHVLRTAADRDGVWVASGGRAWKVADAAEAGARRKAGPAPGAVTPPMPGVVVRVLVEAGARVAKGQALVVVSAMKMETALVAARAGTVTAVRAVVGAAVKPGDVLVDVAADAEEARRDG